MVLRLLLVGHGRMGRLVESAAPEYGFDVVGHVDTSAELPSADSALGRLADVAVDFSTADAFVANLPTLTELGIDLVVGTTGWQHFEREARRLVADADVGIVVAPNFSLGVNLFEAIAAQAARLFAPHDDFGAWLHEAHHAAKRDAPSGTALMLRRSMEAAGYRLPIDVTSTRAGSIPGTHEIGFDGPAETVVISHVTRDRSTFARGALEAARWVHGRKGWFTMRDVLGLS